LGCNHSNGYSLFYFSNGDDMMSRVPILLDEKSAVALVALAKQELRDPRQQAAMIIRQELERRGLITKSPRSDQQAQRGSVAKAQDGNPS
jgi:hypothetical protein